MVIGWRLFLVRHHYGEVVMGDVKALRAVDFNY